MPSSVRNTRSTARACDGGCELADAADLLTDRALDHQAQLRALAEDLAAGVRAGPQPGAALGREITHFGA